MVVNYRSVLRSVFVPCVIVISFFLIFTISRVYADPHTPDIPNVDTPRNRCSHDLASAPFTGIYLCDRVNTPCAAVSSIFTWYADDSNVDAGYERAKGLFAATRWRDVDTLQELKPSTYDYLSVEPPLHMLSIWQQIHRAHHSAIAYVLFDPEQGPFSVTQFEFLPQQVDRNGIPIDHASPIHIRQWWLQPMQWSYPDGYTHDEFQRITGILGLWWHSQGALIDAVPANDYSVATVPQLKQTPTKRWSCQGAFRDK